MGRKGHSAPSTNRSPSSARNLSDVLCSFTIELQSVVPPQLLSLTFASSSPSADVAFDLGVVPARVAGHQPDRATN